MPKPTKGPRLGGSPAHQRIILANLATQLFEHGRITTTEAKAKRLQPLADRLISKAKRGDIHNRRVVLRTVRDKSVVHVLFTEIAPKLADREGGYTRITRLGPRQGDNAPMAVIEVVTESVEDSRKAKAKAKGAAAPKAEPKKAEKAKKADKPKKADKDAAKVEADEPKQTEAAEVAAEVEEPKADDATPAEADEAKPAKGEAGEADADEAKADKDA